MSAHFIRILRPANCVMMGFAVAVGAIISAGMPSAITLQWRLVPGFLVGFILTGSSMVINDYADVDIDRINEPKRPIPSGLISPATALFYGIALMVVGLAFAWLTGPLSLLAASIAWLLFLAYTFYGKRTGFLGNIIVSLCVAIPFVYGAIILDTGIGLRLVIFSLIAFLANLGREVNKGIVDVEGDRDQGVQTIAVRFGVDFAAVASAAMYVAAVVLSLLPVLWSLVSIVFYAPFVIITDLGLVYSSVSLLRNLDRESARSQKRNVLLWMLLGLLAFLAGSSV